MELNWTTPMLIAVVAIVGWFWQDSLRVRERANAAAIDACTRLALQFLDGTVAFSHLRVVRDSGQLRLRRTYIFDYTAHSIERLQGFVVLLGMRVESVGFARDEPQRRPVTIIQANAGSDQSAAAPTASHSSGSQAAFDVKDADGKDAASNVHDLNDWRRNRNPH